MGLLDRATNQAANEQLLGYGYPSGTPAGTPTIDIAGIETTGKFPESMLSTAGVYGANYTPTMLQPRGITAQSSFPTIEQLRATMLDTGPVVIPERTMGSQGMSMDPLATVGGATAAGMGLVQLAVGLNQARKAKRLPFPSFRQAAAPLVESRNLYQQMYERGLGTERENIYRSNLAAQQASAMRNISQGSPQASQFAGRVASLSNIQAEQGITQADIQARQGALAGMERVNSALSALGLRQIASEREYRMLAEQAAGQAIKTGTENIARGALLFGGAQQVT